MRRFKRFTRRATNSRFRSRGTHAVTRPKRWEIGQFYIEQTMNPPNGSNAEQLTMLHIASISQSLLNATANTSESRLGTLLAQSKRALEVGGIVYDWGCYQLNDANANTSRTEGQLTWQHGLCTDKHVATAGSPITPNAILDWSPLQSTFPTRILSTSTAFDDNNEAQQPTRIHFTKTWMMNAGIREVANDVEGVLYVPDGQILQQNFGTVNRRLKLRLDDDQGLYAYFGVLTGAGFSNASSFLVWLGGRIYYRYT